MHIPDGFLDAKTIASTTVFSVGGIGAALRQLKLDLTSREIPMIGLAAAFIFAAQMVNFPVVGGTSGHLIGAVLACVLLGPSAAVIVLTAVLVVQCFLFADGGVLALGANVFNMAIVGSLSGYAVYRLVRKLFPGRQGMLAAVAFASWCSTVCASIMCAGELAWSGTVSWSVAFTAMANVHMLIGIGEGLITTLVVAAVARTRPELLDESKALTPSGRRGSLVVTGALVVLGVLLFVVPFASPWPDGLERVAETLGFQQKAFTNPMVSSPIAGYTVPGIGSPVAATVFAGIVGAAVVFGLSMLLARLLTVKTR